MPIGQGPAQGATCEHVMVLGRAGGKGRWQGCGEERSRRGLFMNSAQTKRQDVLSRKQGTVVAMTGHIKMLAGRILFRRRVHVVASRTVLA